MTEKIDKSRLGELLDEVLELEALICLAMNRDDCSADLLRLIERKRKKISGMETQAPPKVSDDNDAGDERMEYSLDSMEDFEFMPGHEKEEYEKEEGEVYENEDMKDAGSQDPWEDEPEPEETFSEFSAEAEVKPGREQGSLRGRLVFSLNDRYRFKKALFNNSDAEFNTTMAFVASMDNYEEAVEYFLGELGFDGKDPVVADFMVVLEKYF